MSHTEFSCGRSVNDGACATPLSKTSNLKDRSESCAETDVILRTVREKIHYLFDIAGAWRGFPVELY